MDPKGPILRNAFHKSIRQDFACIRQLDPLERDDVRSLIKQNGGKWVGIYHADIEIVLWGHFVIKEQWKFVGSEVRPVECATEFFKHMKDLLKDSAVTKPEPVESRKPFSGLVFAVNSTSGDNRTIALIDGLGGTWSALHDISIVASVVSDGNQSPQIQANNNGLPRTLGMALHHKFDDPMYLERNIWSKSCHRDS